MKKCPWYKEHTEFCLSIKAGETFDQDEVHVGFSESIKEEPQKWKMCGAKTRKGTPCRTSRLFPNGRCKNHGGLSTGPRTTEGKMKAKRNLKSWKKADWCHTEFSESRRAHGCASWASICFLTHPGQTSTHRLEFIGLIRAGAPTRYRVQFSLKIGSRVIIVKFTSPSLLETNLGQNAFVLSLGLSFDTLPLCQLFLLSN